MAPLVPMLLCSIFGCSAHGLVHQLQTVGVPGALSPAASGLWLSCPRLTGWGPLGCCLGWERGDTDGPGWLFLSVISSISPQMASGCQARLSAGVGVRTSRCWVAPSRHGGRAGARRRETGWHHLGTAPLSSASPLTPLEVPSSGPCDTCPLSSFMLLMEN